MVSGRLENEGWLVRKDGSQLWAHSVITSLSKSADSDQGFVMMIWDNRDHREGDEALRSVLDHVLDGIITIDDRALIHSFNPAAERIFG